MKSNDFDVVIIGSGFGGSVAALRLTEKGYKVAVLEAGRRFSDKDFPKTSWRLSRFLYLPRLGLRGIQRIHVLPDVLVLAGAGVGIGSVFSALILSFSRNPGLEKQLFAYAILGFALTEAIALFGLMMAFLILFGF